jgi:hypothetical protein
MTKLSDKVEKIRSKNAGPFWLTIDIFCSDDANFREMRGKLSSGEVAGLFQIEEEKLKRYEIGALNVIKFSLPRPHIQGMADDTDMHGASYAALLEEFEIS